MIVDPEGHIVAKIGKFLGDNTNNYAEYMGLLLGLRRAKAMGLKELEVLCRLRAHGAAARRATTR